jgi:hypothetical protein
MSFVFDIAGAQQAKKIGQYNQSIQERNALIKEQEAEQAQKQLEFDIVKFEQDFEVLEGQTNVAFAKSGVEKSGTALRVQRYNVEQAELQKDVMEYNSKVAQNQKLEEANFARVRGELARMEAKQAELAGYARAGESLLNLSQGSS